MAANYLLASILCLALGNALGQSVMEGTYNVTQVCTMVKTGTQLGSIESCNYYYVCTQSGPVKASCSSGYAYNYKTQNCAPAAQVECYYGKTNPCTGKTGSNWVPNVNNCQGWIYCNGENIGGSGSCANGEKFDSVKQSCVYGKCDNSDGNTAGPSLVNYCSVVPPNIYFGSTSDCKKWYFCSSQGLQTEDFCKSSAFIVSTGSCGYDSTPGACDRVVSVPAPSTCDSTSGPAPDPTICGNYYICSNDVYVLTQCPNGAYFDVRSNKCALRQTATPVKGCNRCQYASTSFVNAVDNSTCSTYYYCSNGKNGDVSSCPKTYFFNEGNQACVPESGLSSYVTNNGACYGAKVESDSSEHTSGENGSSEENTGPEKPGSEENKSPENPGSEENKSPEKPGSEENKSPENPESEENKSPEDPTNG